MEDQKARKHPAPFGPAPPAEPIKYEVVVRHSPFMLKKERVTAANAEEAKRKFIELVKARHERRTQDALTNKAQEPAERMAIAERVRETLADGLARLADFEFTIRPAAEVDAEKKARDELVARAWGPAAVLAVPR